VFITSANLTEAALDRNIELGVLVRDRAFALTVGGYFRNLIDRDLLTLGADSSWGYQGAWMYGALYLWWFYAAGARTTPALKQAAKQRGNVVIDNAFAVHPGFNIP
jgi:phosphatidylserine/phosphatidylglycerophosphate/cardiolipin synthase-like enzyme